jgi:hypothetical protein
VPRKSAADALEAFVRQQDAPTLADVLVELADQHDAVRQRLERLALSRDAKGLAAAFRKTLACSAPQAARDTARSQPL